MCEKNTLKYLLLSAAIVLICSNLTYAQLTDPDLPNRKGLKAGNVIFHSAITSGIQTDSNIFLSNQDAKFDIITLVNPTAGIEIPLRENNFSMDYDLFYNKYAKHPNQSHIDHRIRGLGEIKLTDYKISLSEVWRHFTDRRFSETSTRVKEETNNFRIGLSSQFEKLGFNVGYSNKYQNFLANTPIFGTLTYNDKESLTHIMDAELSYRFLPKTTVTFENDLGFINYKTGNNPDSWYEEMVAGLRGDLHKNLTVNLKGGARYHTYESSHLVNDDTFVGPVVRGGATYNFSDRNIFDLTLERTDYESTYANMNYYALNYIGLNYRHIFNRKWTGNVFGSYQADYYPNDSTEGGKTGKRRDYIDGFGLALRYDIQKWLSFDLTYQFQERNSTFAVFSYPDNITTFRGTIGF